MNGTLALEGERRRCGAGCALHNLNRIGAQRQRRPRPCQNQGDDFNRLALQQQVSAESGSQASIELQQLAAAALAAKTEQLCSLGWQSAHAAAPCSRAAVAHIMFTAAGIANSHATEHQCKVELVLLRQATHWSLTGLTKREASLDCLNICCGTQAHARVPQHPRLASPGSPGPSPRTAGRRLRSAARPLAGSA